MPPRYVIHIGPMKTASTYLQENLTAAREDLLRQGVCYPAELLAENNRFMHLPVFYALLRKRGDSLRPVFAKLNAEGHGTIVLSCEHFHFLPPDAFRTLRDLTGAADFQLIYTSLWNHSIFTGGALSLAEFYLSLLAGEALHYYPRWMKESGAAADLDYSITWRTLADIFGRDALTIFPYSSIVDRGEDIYETFCRDVLGLAQSPATALTGQRRWASMSTETQEIVRVLNDMHFNATGDANGAMSAPFMRARKKLQLSRTGAAMEAETRQLLIDDRSAQFDAAFEAMQAYADRVSGGMEIFERKSKPVQYVRSGYLLQDGVREELQAAYSHIVANLPVRTRGAA